MEYRINFYYSTMQDELQNWYNSQPFENLAKIHEIEESTMYGKSNEETQAMLDELEDEWVEWSTDTKVMWYNEWVLNK
jgi:hypothetical protein